MYATRFFKIFIVIVLSSSMFSCTGVRKGAVKAADDSWSFIKGIFKKQDDVQIVQQREVITKEEYVWKKVEENWSDIPSGVETIVEKVENLREDDLETETSEENSSLK